MNLILAFISAALLLAIVVRWAMGFRQPPFLFLAARLPILRRRGVFALANVAEGQNLHGQKTFISDVTTAARFLIAKTGSASTNVAVATNADFPIGVMTDQVGTAGDPVAVSLFGASEGTQKVSVQSVVNFGDWLVVDPANPGYALTKPAANGTYWVFGKALNLTASAAGDIIEFTPCLPRQITIAGGTPTVTA
jgi:hypothetical protein